MSARAIVRDLRAAFAASADPVRARGQQRYMKSAMPYYGVRMAEVDRICARTFAAHALEDEASWRRAVLALWRGAKRREERYAAIRLAGHRLYRDYQTMRALPLYEEMIVTGAWWDLVDDVAAHRLGPLFDADARAMSRAMRVWSRSRDMWKRRASILSQLARKERTDRALLYACIEANAGDPEFFLRKAIGWALRAYACVAPAAVRRFVREHDAELSPLSKREATKHLR